jgi:nucleoside-diphosphate-sugar epimerase
MKKERILIIGAGGQLGSELTEHLAAKFGREDVLPTDIKEPSSHQYHNFETLDVLNQSALNSFIKKNDFTQIYHLAAVLSATGEKNPAFAWRLNMDGLFHVLEAAVNFKIRKVYWPSSIAVFGPGTPRHDTPQHTVMDPTTVYGISKLAGERWCEWYHNKYDLDVRSLRYPGLIGYKSHPGGGTTDYAVDIFFKALSDKRYECFLKEDTSLPMMYMDDAIKATIDLMDAPSERIRVRSSYNIASISFTPRQIADEIRAIIPDFQITYNPDFRQAIAESWPGSIDDSVARKDWGWKPRFDLRSMTQEILTKLPQYHFQPTR